MEGCQLKQDVSCEVHPDGGRRVRPTRREHELRHEECFRGNGGARPADLPGGLLEQLFGDLVKLALKARVDEPCEACVLEGVREDLFGRAIGDGEGVSPGSNSFFTMKTQLF